MVYKGASELCQAVTQYHRVFFFTALHAAPKDDLICDDMDGTYHTHNEWKMRRNSIKEFFILQVRNIFI